MTGWIALIVVAYLLIGAWHTVRFMRSFRAYAEEEGVAHRLSTEQWIHTWINASVFVVAWPLDLAVKPLAKASPRFKRWVNSGVDRWLAKPRTPGPSPWQRAATRLAHYQPVIVIGVLVTALIDDVVFQRSWPAELAYFMIFLLFVVTLIAELHHSYLLCSRCGAATPVDGSGMATRRSKWLRFYHWTKSRKSMVMFGVAVLLTPALSAVLHFPWVVTSLPVYLYMAADSLSGLRHRPLQPWCPQCRWGDGGDEEQVPVPPPVPTEQATR